MILKNLKATNINSANTLDFVTEFDGVNEYLTLPSSDYLQNLEYTDAFSISVWIYSEPSTGTEVINKWRNAGPADGWFMSILNPSSPGIYAGRVRFQLRTNDTSYFDAYSLGAVSAEEWTHIVVTYNGNGSRTGVTWYINNSSSLADTGIGVNALTGGSMITGLPIHVGANTSLGRYSTGKKAELAIFDVELTSGQVNTIYNRGKENPNYNDISGIRHHWMLSELFAVDKIALSNVTTNNNMDSTNIIGE